MSEFITLARVGDVPPGQGRMARAGTREIALFFLDGRSPVAPTLCAETYEVRLVGDEIQVRVADEGG